MQNQADLSFKASIVHGRHGAFDLFWKGASGEYRRNQFGSATEARAYAKEVGANVNDVVEQR